MLEKLENGQCLEKAEPVAAPPNATENIYALCHPHRAVFGSSTVSRGGGK